MADVNDVRTFNSAFMKGVFKFVKTILTLIRMNTMSDKNEISISLVYRCATQSLERDRSLKIIHTDLVEILVGYGMKYSDGSIIPC